MQGPRQSAVGNLMSPGRATLPAAKKTPYPKGGGRGGRGAGPAVMAVALPPAAPRCNSALATARVATGVGLELACAGAWLAAPRRRPAVPAPFGGVRVPGARSPNVGGFRPYDSGVLSCRGGSGPVTALPRQANPD